MFSNRDFLVLCQVCKRLGRPFSFRWIIVYTEFHVTDLIAWYEVKIHFRCAYHNEIFSESISHGVLYICLISGPWISKIPTVPKTKYLRSSQVEQHLESVDLSLCLKHVTNVQ